jgi:hypothetical protein
MVAEDSNQGEAKARPLSMLNGRAFGAYALVILSDDKNFRARARKMLG